VGVAAFPYGHPRSGDVDEDTKFLVRKLRAGADFAIAQLFFEPEDFLRLRDRVDALGCDTALIPGLMPLTTPRTLAKTIELSGADVPPSVARKLDPFVDDPAAFRKAGVDLVTEMGERLLAEGVPSLHFYTLNRSKATREVVARLGLVPART
jgi:methylenetetrahydrofolate reductase (NADPH)